MTQKPRKPNTRVRFFAISWWIFNAFFVNFVTFLCIDLKKAMICRSIVVLLLAAIFVGHFAAGQSCFKPPKEPIESVITSPLPHTYLKPSMIPRTYDWRNISGVNYCTSSRNQHIPQYCGSCWAMASSSALADRIRITRKSSFPDFMIAVQTLVYCVSSGCHGGSALEAYKYIHLHGIGSDTCQNYVALGTGQQCSPLHVCENCVPGNANTSCTAVTDFPKFGISEMGSIVGIEEMKAEIYARGPIACVIDAGPISLWGFGPNRTGIFSGCSAAKHPGKCANFDHEISVVGFGYDKAAGMDYWVVRNSWGEYWGDVGYFRVKMGDDQIGLESGGCVWAVPKIPKL